MNPTPIPIDYAAQPYQGTDVVAFVLGLVAVLCVALWRRDGERGLGWYGLGLALLATWVATTRQHLPVDRLLVASPWFFCLTFGFAFMALGLVNHLNVPTHLRGRILWAVILPVALYTLLVGLAVAGLARVPREWIALLAGIYFAVMGALAWWASRREPGAGHAYLAAVLWIVPLFAAVMTAAKVDPVALRYWGVFPVMFWALTLLTVILLRRRRALEAEVARRGAAEQALRALNASLEATVAERTADLQLMVAGLESFNRNVSHDLRGSLGGIAGAARLANEALRRGDEALALRALPLIADQAEKSTNLVAALLALAQVGDSTLQCQAVDLRRLVHEVVAQLASERSGLPMPAIEVQDLPAVQADPELLRRIFANLIGNAIKFTRDGAAPRIDISATVAVGEITVSVRDNGVGFDADAAARLFKPFARLHGAKFDGHGVGLSIVRRAVERHGGRVWAESQPGAGAAFHFSLPRAN